MTRKKLRPADIEKKDIQLTSFEPPPPPNSFK